jgi:cystathionine beta-lyase
MVDLKRLPEEASHGCSHFGVISHTAALRFGRDWLDRLLVGLDENRQLLADLVATHLPGIGTANRRARIWRGWTAAG